jgi:16S rRNA pseudouridine516 synthase
MKLVRLVAKHQHQGHNAAQRLIAAGQISVNTQVVRDPTLEVDRFQEVSQSGLCIHPAEEAVYMMLNKPAGYLSATRDATHPTVIDLIQHPLAHELHLAGRLDRSSTGLLLLTNNGHWSKQITEGPKPVPKVYHVTTLEPLSPLAVKAFSEGFYFHTEDIYTQPAELEILGEKAARVTLGEGRYHQIKRMFHRVQNRVTTLHRERIGSLSLPADLLPGDWRLLSAEDRRLAVTA